MTPPKTKRASVSVNAGQAWAAKEAVALETRKQGLKVVSIAEPVAAQVPLGDDFVMINVVGTEPKTTWMVVIEVAR